jgi:acetyltransferase-like isoleucine patch superfamily enzyme
MSESFSGRFFAAFKWYFANNVALKAMPYFARHWYLRKICGISIGQDSSIAMKCYISGPNIRIGCNTVINRFSYLDGRAPLYIGNNVNISHYTLIHTLTHDAQNPFFIAVQRPVAIMDHAWVGAREIILPGVVVGEGAVVGAGAVVTKDVEPYSIVGGNPARRIGYRTRDLRYKSRYFPFFDTDIQ